ncbi:uncharacterized protein LOC141668461 isoform X2 [Apium graveolens]|uniref:uncharacterized protein LOC141668461 isoform X2 n=1 Tax=Apium graveolens TaxID=4045 RepID=UPI003D7A7404
MSLLSVSSKLLSSLPRPRVLGTICSCFRLLSHSYSSSIVTSTSVHFHAYSSISSSPNYIPHSTHVPESHLKLQQLLTQNKSGFDNVDDALLLFRKMLKMRPLPCDFHFNQLLTALVKMKQCEVAFSFFRDMCTLSIPINIFTFNIVINCCCHSDRLDCAFSLLAAIFKRGFVPDVVTYSTLIRGLLSQHKSVEARLLFENLIKFREVQPNVVTFSIMIDGLCKTGHTDMALWLFRFMEKSYCKPNTVTYNTVIDSYCKRGLVDHALTLHSEMMDKRIFPDVWTYNSIIQVLCNLNRWEEVSMLLKQMMEDMKITPSVHTFNILVNAYSKSGKLDDAEHIIQIMSEKGVYPDIITYNTLIQAYCKQGEMDAALAVLSTIKSKKMMPDCYTYNILLDACCRELKLEKALDLYRKMASEGLSPHVVTYNILLHGLCQRGRPVEALTFFFKTQDQGLMPDIVTYQTLLGGLCKNHCVDKALSLFQAMECNGLNPENDTYNIIIRGCLRSKKYKEACKLVDKMFDCGFIADVITTSLLQHLLLSKVQDPTILAMQQKCLHSVFLFG